MDIVKHEDDALAMAAGPNIAWRIALGSLGISVLVLGIKYLAYVLTGSVALYSDALESIINVGTALAAIVAIRIASQPADDTHPYGHHKAEYVSAAAVGAMIMVAALTILRSAYNGFMNPTGIETPLLGMAVSGAATFLNIGWSWVLITQGRKQQSAALVSDGKHLMADVVTSVGVIIGLVLVVVTGQGWLDPMIAALVALHVLWSGWVVIRDNTSGLLDEAVPAEDLQRIEAVIEAERDGTIEVHDLRTRHSGKVVFIDFHMVVDGTMNVADAHAICDRIEMALRRVMPGAMVTIHVEPEFKAKKKLR